MTIIIFLMNLQFGQGLVEIATPAQPSEAGAAQNLALGSFEGLFTYLSGGQCWLLTDSKLGLWAKICTYYLST